MSYRPEWWDGHSRGRSVVQMAQTLHEMRSGATDYDDVTVRECRLCLDWLLKNWKPSDSTYDNAVHTLIVAAIEGSGKAGAP